MRISLFAVPIILAGFYLGPIYGLMVGFAVDTVYFMISPYASFWSLYTITTTIWGLSGWLIRKMQHRYHFFAFVIIIFLTSIFETAWNSFANYFYGLDVWGTMFFRVITMLARLPILVFVVNVLTEKIKVLEVAISKS
jgi:ECF transporter S component (folate family)